MVRDKVKADRVGENEAFIKAVFKQLQRDPPAGLRARGERRLGVNLPPWRRSW
jgi:hypothetical protein